MSKSLQPGENLVIESISGTVIITHDIDHRLDINLTAFLVTDAGKVQGDSGIVYYNQPIGPSGVATFIPPENSGSIRNHKINFDLNKATGGITKIAITLTEDKHSGFIAVNNLKAEVHAGSEIIKLVPGKFTTENGIIVLELYMRSGQPKIRAVWQGFSSGLDGLCKNYGVEVEDSPAIIQVPVPTPANQIPSRTALRYSGQYAGTIDKQRLIEILTDSYKIAIASKKPDTARERFELAIEVYHQLISLGISGDRLATIQNAMTILATQFPTQVFVNEALGLREKAAKLKTARKKLELLHQARDVLQRGLTDNGGTSYAISHAADQVREEIAQVEATST